ncbi:MAG: Gfo/Idh/MocA family oxidoreductase [Bacteroidota bacterium]
MPNNDSRRKFLRNLGLAGMGMPLMSATGHLDTFSFMSSNKSEGKLGVALVGLGSYAGGQLAPALQQTGHCYLAGIVTGTPGKAATWKEKYNISDKSIYNYESFDTIKDNPDIDIVYIVLPNFMHAEYTIRAANAGKHVICEKPMALSVEDCDSMITACKNAGKMLSIGYRLHFDPYHLEVARIGQQKMFGDIKKINTGFSFIARKGEWRLDKKRSGGGPLMDLGIYCLQAVCYSTGMEPLAVTAQTFPVSDKEKFVDIEETLAFQMEMPDGLVATCRTSYSENANSLEITTAKGIVELQPAFNYGGIKGKTPNGPLQYAPMSQQARQMDGFAQAIKNKQPSIVPGEMGKRDVKIIKAIYEAMHTGKRVVL